MRIVPSTTLTTWFGSWLRPRGVGGPPGLGVVRNTSQPLRSFPSNSDRHARSGFGAAGAVDAASATTAAHAQACFMVSSRAAARGVYAMTVLKTLAELLQSVTHRTAEPSAAERERGLRLAAAALLFEVVRADGVVKPEETTVMRAALHSAFDLSAEELEQLVALAEQASRQAVSLYEFTALVDQGFSADEKKRIVELLWLVTFADAEKHAQEEHLVRTIAGLLHVSHPDFIDAKIRARAASSGSSPGAAARRQ